MPAHAISCKKNIVINITVCDLAKVVLRVVLVEVVLVVVVLTAVVETGRSYPGWGARLRFVFLIMTATVFTLLVRQERLRMVRSNEVD